MSEGRNTARRNRFRRYWLRRREDCAVCGEAIDYEADHRHPLSFQVDHITPLNKGGTDTLDNTQPCHRKCNRDKSDSLPEQALPGDGPLLVGVTFVTHRTWRP
ncbi:HNH endonuclease [Mycobacterium phage PhelpsODU]|uniref:HNH endonuclease n=2 Tax=Unicornvirus TaxID=2948939 RepID=A0A222ZM94_9CAUD|nr:HNH endonuclease [Mycobacterium phage Bryler]YP_009951472.1 HNH endonuclease [Mycobacterium phage Krueger]ASR85200.1 HNH endonuclease [Mycobacterium phage PhelpsODU]ASR85501.1 HNH endonuclease [Mycobacterium phage Cain]ASR85598.1 HNH endonuclease [Mycobacterium phage Krueger]QGH80469.1 HNH endonuclease [Mycobacterium phage Bryler]